MYDRLVLVFSLLMLLLSCVPSDARPPKLRHLQGACAPDCDPSWLDDGECQPECDNYACDLDKGDCHHPDFISRDDYKECPASCPLSYIGDEWCDVECNVSACHYDKQDCRPGCAPGCKWRWRGDGYCDEACDNKDCQYDENDCKHPNLDLAALAQCPYTCSLSWIADGYCDEECDNALCLFDKNDCGEEPPEKTKCSSDCEPQWLGDGICDFECNYASCEYDKGDCPRMPAECEAAADECSALWLGDNECDPECNWPECEYDKGDCTAPETPLSACEKQYPSCLPPWLGDGECDAECNNKDCEYDREDCPLGVPVECASKAADCQRDWLGDGECDPECDIEECNWDWHDCQPMSQQCVLTASDCVASWLGDGECDPECYTKECNYDEDDCQEPAPCFTIGDTGVGEDVDCVFPFTYRGVQYDKCTTTNSDFAWCSTQISSRGEHVKDQWGECAKSCETTCLTVGDAGVGADYKCEFPFKYGGIEYDSCTAVEHTAPWCSTSTGDDFGYKQGQFGECSPRCKGYSAAMLSGTERKKSLALFLAIVVMGVILCGLGCTVAYMSRRIKQLGVGNAPRSEYAQKIGNTEDPENAKGPGN